MTCKLEVVSDDNPVTIIIFEIKLTASVQLF